MRIWRGLTVTARGLPLEQVGEDFSQQENMGRLYSWGREDNYLRACTGKAHMDGITHSSHAILFSP